MNSMDLGIFLDRTVAYESLPARIDPRLRRLAWTATASLGVLLIYLELTWRLIDLNQRPVFFLVGWNVLADTIRLGGHALVTLRGCIATFGASLVLATVTRGFRFGRVWAQIACLPLGLAGLAAAIPPVVALAVLVVNAVAWFLLGLFLLAAVAAVMSGAPARDR
jgi:hypothetical protein